MATLGYGGLSFLASSYLAFQVGLVSVLMGVLMSCSGSFSGILAGLTVSKSNDHPSTRRQNFAQKIPGTFPLSELGQGTPRARRSTGTVHESCVQKS